MCFLAEWLAKAKDKTRTEVSGGSSMPTDQSPSHACVTQRDWFEQAVTDGLAAGWISRTFTKRRLNALRTVQEKMDKKSQGSLPPMVIFAPSIYDGGQVMRREMPPDFAFVYLSPTLEFDWQVEVDFIVAHELSHVVLGHGRQRQRTHEEVGLPHESTAAEIAASELVAKWRIPKWERNESRFLKLLEKVLASETDDKRLKKQEDQANKADGLLDGVPPGDESFDTVIEHLDREEDEVEDADRK